MRRLSRAATLAELNATAFSRLGQSCLSGVVLNLTASLVIFYLWRRDSSERYLAFWSSAHLSSALR